jgi:hypothetical protein
MFVDINFFSNTILIKQLDNTRAKTVDYIIVLYFRLAELDFFCSFALDHI